MPIQNASRRMQIYGALLLLPAAVLLGTFAYLPTVSTRSASPLCWSPSCCSSASSCSRS
nr:hypothetical protein [Halomonas sp. BC04]